MRVNRAKLTRVAQLVERTTAELAANPGQTCSRTPLWRQDVLAIEYVLRLLQVELTRPWRERKGKA